MGRPRAAAMFFYGLADAPYDSRRLAQAGGLQQIETVEDWIRWGNSEEEYGSQLDLDDPHDDCETIQNFFRHLDQQWEDAGDPVCVGLYAYGMGGGSPHPYLAIRATRHRTLHYSGTSYCRFSLPDPLDQAEWEKLLLAKCKTYSFQWSQPSFCLFTAGYTIPYVPEEALYVIYGKYGGISSE